MKTRILKALIILILGIMIWGCDVILAENEGELKASGVVEAVEVVVIAEVSGRVKDITFEEGEFIQTGQVLVRMEDDLLLAQLHQAEAALATARANYDLTAATSGINDVQREALIAAAAMELTAAEKALADLYENHAVMASQAQLILANAQDELDDAEYRWRVRQEGNRASQDTIAAAEANLVLADREVDTAQKAFNRLSGKPSDDPHRAVALSNLVAAKNHRDDILRQLNWYTGSPTEIDQAILDAEVAIAQAQVEKALLDWNTLKQGPDPEELALAESRVNNARAQLAAAQAENPTEEQLAVSQALIDTAAANLELVQVQVDKSVIAAPVPGVVLSRNVEVGESVGPGSTLLVIGQLEDLTLTVYVPEDQYGRINLGDKTVVTSDSFPDTSFQARVVRIADEAEFTPRNVQTEEGRRTTVFAVKLKVDDPEGMLKPGMPVDVRFQE